MCLGIGRVVTITSAGDPHASVRRTLPTLGRVVLPVLTRNIPIFCERGRGNGMTFCLKCSMFRPLLTVTNRLIGSRTLGTTLIRLMGRGTNPLKKLTTTFIGRVLSGLPSVVTMARSIRVNVSLVSTGWRGGGWCCLLPIPGRFTTEFAREYDVLHYGELCLSILFGTVAFPIF